MFYSWRRSVAALVALALVSAVLLGPGAAHARPRGVDRSPFIGEPADLLWNELWAWAAGRFDAIGGGLGGFLERAGWGMDPNGGGGTGTSGSTTASPDAGWGMDPNGL
jgi:hypothetical protein